MEDNMSAAATGLLLLVWQAPSDRALAGWTPYPGFRSGRMPPKGLTDWLKDQMRISMTEADDLARLHTVH